MRIISGTLKGRKIDGYNIEGTRPTMDRVKESVFGSIQNYIKDAQVLDLFAGSGNLGIEAISNGCKYCYFIDNNIKCTNFINSILSEFNIKDKAKVMNMDYGRAIKEFSIKNIKFDIIFVDPPYDYHNINKVVDKIIKYDILSDKGILVLEYRDDKINIDNKIFNLYKNKKYGDKFIIILKKTID